MCSRMNCSSRSDHRARHVQSCLGTPPQYILSAARPFVGDQILHFAREETATEVDTEV
jgi:hypothetical protein